MSDSRRDFESVKTILSIWGFGLIFTLVSGLYVVEPFIFDASRLYYGFPFPWFEAARAEFDSPYGPWRFNFLWFWFIVDLALYVMLVLVATAIHDKKLRDVDKPKLYKNFFLTSSIAFVILHWFPYLLLQILPESILERFFSYGPQFGYFIRYLFGELTIIYAWSLMKYREITTEYRKAILATVIAILTIFLLDIIILLHLPSK